MGWVRFLILPHYKHNMNPELLMDKDSILNEKNRPAKTDNKVPYVGYSYDNKISKVYYSRTVR